MTSDSPKIVVINKSAIKELGKFPIEVQARFNDFFEILKNDGKLEMPFAKKIGRNIFEIRLYDRAQWRAIYAYSSKDRIIILSAFQKKAQQTPKHELVKSINRLKQS